MDINRFKLQHVQILKAIHQLRQYAKAGIVENAPHLSRELLSIKSKIKLHLAIEDDILYPRLQKKGDPLVSQLAHRYQAEMQSLAADFLAFVDRWGHTDQIAGNPEAFRQDCNVVIKALHQRIQRENLEFYPAAERLN
ncbi:hemerythrin domain-containing protein [Castellaniella hirudinis]|uniref:hemerythrin domain-containing protein n=1 Tax=Castellaniella hirudinis TaxID=1144617 RepID=UPI0039C46917